MVSFSDDISSTAGDIASFQGGWRAPSHEPGPGRSPPGRPRGRVGGSRSGSNAAQTRSCDGIRDQAAALRLGNELVHDKGRGVGLGAAIDMRTTLNRPFRTVAPGGSAARRDARCAFSPCAAARPDASVASRSEAAEDSHDVRVLQRSREEAVRRGTLGHGDTHTRPVDAVRNGLPGRAT